VGFGFCREAGGLGLVILSIHHLSFIRFFWTEADLRACAGYGRSSFVEQDGTCVCWWGIERERTGGRWRWREKDQDTYMCVVASDVTRCNY